MADYTFTNHGSIWLCTPTTMEAREHLEEHLSDEAQWFAGGVAVEPRYVDSLAAQLEEDGFTTEV